MGSLVWTGNRSHQARSVKSTPTERWTLEVPYTRHDSPARHGRVPPSLNRHPLAQASVPRGCKSRQLIVVASDMLCVGSRWRCRARRADLRCSSGTSVGRACRQACKAGFLAEFVHVECGVGHSGTWHCLRHRFRGISCALGQMSSVVAVQDNATGVAASFSSAWLLFMSEKNVPACGVGVPPSWQALVRE